MDIGLHVKYPLSWSDLNITWNSLDSFFSSLNTPLSNFMKICPMGVELFLAEIYDEVNSSFSKFCETRLITCEEIPQDITYLCYRFNYGNLGGDVTSHKAQ